MSVFFYQDVESVLGALLILFDGGEHRQNQAGEHQQEPEQRTDIKTHNLFLLRAQVSEN